MKMINSDCTLPSPLYIERDKLYISLDLATKATIHILLDGVKWSGRKKAWYLYSTEENIKAVEKIFKQRVMRAAGEPIKERTKLVLPKGVTKNLKKTIDDVLAKRHFVPEDEYEVEDVTEADTVYKGERDFIKGEIVDLDAIQFPFKTTPMGHQVKALLKCGGRKAFAYFMEPGLGKSKTLIDDAMILHRDGEVHTVIVICPKSVISTWWEEIQIHGHYDHWDVALWDGDRNKPGWEWVNGGRGNTTMYWRIINEDALKFTHGWNAIEATMLESGANGMMCVDESTSIRNTKSLRTRRINEIGMQMGYRRILTGTPIANTRLDLFSQLVFLDHTIFKAWSFDTFKRHFCDMGGFKGREIIGYKNEDELIEVVKEHAFRATKADCLDLPKRTFHQREVSLTKKTWKLYDELVTEAIKEFEGLGVIKAKKKDAADILKVMTKVRQITGGWVILDDEKDEKGNITAKGKIIQVGTEKLQELDRVMDELGDTKTIVWCQFIHEVLGVADHLEKRGYRINTIYGAKKTWERDRARDGLKKGYLDVLVIQNDTGAMGLTLNTAKAMVFYSNHQLYMIRNQASERNYRKGQLDPVSIWDLTVMGSIDQTILQRLAHRGDLADGILDPHKLKEAIRPQRHNWKGRLKDRTITPE